MLDKYEDIDAPQLIKMYDEEIYGFFDTHVSTANLLLPRLDFERQKDRIYASNKSIWGDVLADRLRATLTLTLKDFLLLEWLPRAPGMFYTPEAEEARRGAMSFIVASPLSKELHDIDDAGHRLDYTYIFDPYGKIKMLNGGIGCIRLTDKTIESGKVWFMSATSTPSAHEGFPIALPEHYYRKYIDRIINQGAMKCTLTGELRILPDPLVRMFSRYANVPQLYLEVDKLVPSDTLLDTGIKPRVSAAVSFQSEYEGSPKMYASYVTFYPGEEGSFQNRIKWLSDTYVRGMYQGEIVTNFDEYRTHFGSDFDNAILDIEKVMNNKLNKSDINRLLGNLNIYGNVTMLFEGLNKLNVERVEKMTQDKIINIGDGAIINAPVVVADHIEKSFVALADASLSNEVETLIKQLLQQITNVGKSISEEKARALASDAETLTKEVTSEKPRKKWYELSIEGIKEAATALGETGKPILETTSKLLPLLISLWP